MRRTRGLSALVALALTVPVTVSLPQAQAAPTADPVARATAAADQAAATGLDALARGADESFSRVSTTAGGAGLFYSSYERTYRGLKVVGGDAVVVTDGQGRVHDTTAADTAPLTVGTTAKIDAATAANTARSKVSTVNSVDTPKLVVLAGSSPKLAYEVVVLGRNGTTPSNLHVFVDATNGSVVESYDDVKAGTGDSYYNGDVNLDTTSSGGTFSMADPTRSGVLCGRDSNKTVFSGPDDNWGNGSGTDLETACADALYAVQREWDMLRDWLGRNGIDGQGKGFPAYVGLPDVNAYWTGSYTQFGRTQDSQRQVTPMDVVGHEFGHAIFQTTPGGSGGGGTEKGGMNESTGDIFGALTEAYANNPNDPADFEVGEEVNLVGNGPIRYMYQPNRISGHPNCWSTSLPGSVHAAAGPQNHWFYLLSEGSNPGGGKPASPTCDGSTVTGIGIQKAGKIFYNGLLQKTTSWNHAAARRATLQAAVSLFPGSCAEYNATKAAWNAISVPVQSGEATCTPNGGNDFSIALTPASGSVQPGGSASTTVGTQITAGNAQTVTFSASGLPSGATATFNPGSVQSGASSTLAVATTTSTPAGTYQVTVTGDGADVDHTAQFTLTVGTTGTRTFTNGTDFPIADLATVRSPVSSTATGSAVSPVKLSVTINHTCAYDLRIQLVGPSGRTYTAKQSGTGGCSQFGTKTYDVPVTTENASGTWTLVVTDAYSVDTGTLDTWTITV
ncbi:Zn-dependent metalloprotease [Kibdelosporangium banguiense]|uniref:Zn-dependent metalloprotease n=1 Tax=Kibdelosporangium banguiense TaxID=1365924 RepID=A0ABS4T8L8_9PSEU|nr:M4 family metallopeptidase [Kibdelosporangium banguiense]MBP2320776.1 Zn-dependent metalloprotease [Kibdelosporangium banguiense]